MNCTTSALAIVISPKTEEGQHLIAKLDRCRRSCDKAFSRWMPHINLFFPFVDGPQAIRLLLPLQRALESLSGSFEVEFGEISSFTQGDGTETFHLKPEDYSEGALMLQEIYKKCCNDLGIHASKPFKPHLTLAQWPLPGNANAEPAFTKAKSAAELKRIITAEVAAIGESFTVSELVVLTRPSNQDIARKGLADRFTVQYRIPIGKKPQLSVSRGLRAPLDATALGTRQQTAAALLLQSVRLSEQWLAKMRLMDARKLPKTRQALERALAPFTRHRVQMNAKVLLETLVRKGLLQKKIKKIKAPGAVPVAAKAPVVARGRGGRGGRGGRAPPPKKAAPAAANLVSVGAYQVNKKHEITRHDAPPTAGSAWRGDGAVNDDYVMARVLFFMHCVYKRHIPKDAKDTKHLVPEKSLEKELAAVCSIAATVSASALCDELANRNVLRFAENPEGGSDRVEFVA